MASFHIPSYWPLMIIIFLLTLYIHCKQSLSYIRTKPSIFLKSYRSYFFTPVKWSVKMKPRLSPEVVIPCWLDGPVTQLGTVIDGYWALREVGKSRRNLFKCHCKSLCSNSDVWSRCLTAWTKVGAAYIYLSLRYAECCQMLPLRI